MPLLKSSDVHLLILTAKAFPNTKTNKQKKKSLNFALLFASIVEVLSMYTQMTKQIQKITVTNLRGQACEKLKTGYLEVSGRRVENGARKAIPFQLQTLWK